MGAWEDKGRSHFVRSVMREIEGLNIETERTGINDGIGMIGLSLQMLGANNMHKRVIIYRGSAHEALDRAFDLRQIKNFTDNLRFVPILSTMTFVFTLLLIGGFIQFLRHDFIKLQEAIH